MKVNDVILKEIINQMFIIAGHPEVSYDDVIGRKDAWYLEWTMTEDQNKEWRDWAVAYLKKKRFYKKIAEKEIAMLDLYCGLKIKN